MAASLSLPTRAQLLELRRAGVTEYRRTLGDETVLLTLRPLYSGRRPDEGNTHRSYPEWSQMTVAQQQWALLSRSQRRRRNVRMDKAHARSTLKIQSVARGMLARLAAKQLRSSTSAITLIQNAARRFLAWRKQQLSRSTAASPWIAVKRRKRRAPKPSPMLQPAVRSTPTKPCTNAPPKRQRHVQPCAPSPEAPSRVRKHKKPCKMQGCTKRIPAAPNNDEYLNVQCDRHLLAGSAMSMTCLV